jgi:hypothetical protein
VCGKLLGRCPNSLGLPKNEDVWYCSGIRLFLPLRRKFENYAPHVHKNESPEVQTQGFQNVLAEHCGCLQPAHTVYHATVPIRVVFLRIFNAAAVINIAMVRRPSWLMLH